MTQLKLAVLFVCLIALAIANPTAQLDDPLEDDSFENPDVDRIERGNEDNFEDDEDLDDSMTDLEREDRDEDFDEIDEEDDFKEDLERQDRAEPKCKQVRVSPKCRCRGHRIKHGGLIVSLKMLKEFSSNTCKENLTFGLTWNNRRVWIKNGCTANFLTCYLPVIRWRSKSGRRHRKYGKEMCQSYTVKPCPNSKKCRKWFRWNSITSYQMTKEFSKGVCKKDNTFGTNKRKSTIWVNGGCDAEFKVCYKSRHPFFRKLRKNIKF